MWSAWLSFIASLMLLLFRHRRQKKYITPTLIPPAARGKFKPEWETKNHYVDELAPLNRYLFIYSLIYLSLETRGINK